MLVYTETRTDENGGRGGHLSDDCLFSLREMVNVWVWQAQTAFKAKLNESMSEQTHMQAHMKTEQTHKQTDSNNGKTE